MIQNRAPQTHRTAIQRLQKIWMNLEVKNDIIELTKKSTSPGKL